MIQTVLQKISNILFYTDGCGITTTCGSLTTELVKGQTVKDALKVSPVDIIDKLGESLEGSFHCAILAVSTLHNAIADYLLKKRNVKVQSYVLFQL